MPTLPSARVIAAAMAAALVAGVLLDAQAPPPQGRGRGAGGPAGRGGRGPYPARPPVDPAILERGKALYSVHCAFCHGADARGGDGGGPNLLRSQLVLSDQKGERIGEVVLNGRPATGMPPIALTSGQVSDIADYLHAFPVGGDDRARRVPPTIVVGDPGRGAAAFTSRCGACHSAAGDLTGLAARFTDARQLQDYWLVPTPARGRGAGAAAALRPVTAAVTLPSGERVEGRLLRIDDFTVTIVPADGMPRSFGRRGDVPRVDITDPVQPHRDLLPAYTDAEIHDITAYLVTLK
jgi:mono/diheme cytochrome c family protein